MNCMKCGRDIPGGSFCESCLADMQRYPIKPDAVVQLPPQREAAKKVTPRRRGVISEQEQLRRTRLRLHRTRIAFGVTLALLILVSSVTVFLFSRSRRPLLGQNYSTSSTKATDEP